MIRIQVYNAGMSKSYAIWGIWDNGSDQGQREFTEYFDNLDEARKRWKVLSCTHSIYNLSPKGFQP